MDILEFWCSSFQAFPAKLKLNLKNLNFELEHVTTSQGLGLRRQAAVLLFLLIDMFSVLFGF